MPVEWRDVIRRPRVHQDPDPVTLDEQGVEHERQPAVPLRYPEHLRSGNLHPPYLDGADSEGMVGTHARYPPSTGRFAPVT